MPKELKFDRVYRDPISKAAETVRSVLGTEKTPRRKHWDAEDAFITRETERLTALERERELDKRRPVTLEELDAIVGIKSLQEKARERKSPKKDR